MFVAAQQHELALRREALTTRSARLRHEVAVGATVLQRPLHLADAAWRGWRWLQANPEAVLATVVVVVVVRPRRAWMVARWSWKGWRVWRRLYVLVAAAQSGYARARQRFESL